MLFHFADEPAAFLRDGRENAPVRVQQPAHRLDECSGEAFHFADLIDDEQVGSRSIGIEDRHDIPLEARILGYAVASTDPEWFTLAPGLALRKLSEKLNLKIGDIDIFELNEAFAVVPMLAMQELKIPHEKVNIYGGAIALGHPIGASGARILGTGITALHKTGGKVGVASACNGGGEAWVIAFEKV